MLRKPTASSRHPLPIIGGANSARTRNSRHIMTIGTIILWTILAIVLFLSGYIIYTHGKIKDQQNRQHQRFHALFENKSFPMPPTLIFGSSYGWPTFTIIFSSKADFDLAKERKLLDLFEREIALFYKSDFRKELAISFKYLDESKQTQFASR